MHTTALLAPANLVSSNSTGSVDLITTGATMVGVGMLIVAAGMLISPRKPGATAARGHIQKAASVVIALAGIGIIVYTWTAS